MNEGAHQEGGSEENEAVEQAKTYVRLLRRRIEILSKLSLEDQAEYLQVERELKEVNERIERRLGRKDK